MKKKRWGFGKHLMLDGYGCDKQKLMDMMLIYDFLDHYPEEMEMTKIMPPYVFRYSGKSSEEWGFSGFVLIAESHISIHTFPEKGFLSLDVFSCKDFNTNKAVSYVTNLFSIQSKEINILNRGLEYPKQSERAIKIIRQERKAL